MTEAIFGIAGVFVGAFLAWFQNAWTERTMRERHARYLAIRVVCILDKYIENCTEVALDDGLCEGRPNEEGCLEPQVSPPAPPTFPEDLDWKSIDHALMYRLLSLPSEAEAASRMVGAASEHAFPPDYEEAFEQRQYEHAKLGLNAFALTEEIRKKYDIPARELDHWDPIEHLMKTKARIDQERRERHKRTAAVLFSAGAP